MTALLQVSAVFKECIKMHECNSNFAFPLYSFISTANFDIHFFLFAASIRGLSQKIVYIACYLKINARIELIFSHLQDKLSLSMHNISKYLTFMLHSNKHMASYIVLGFTVRRMSTSPSKVTLACFHLDKFHCILFKFWKVSFSPK